MWNWMSRGLPALMALSFVVAAQPVRAQSQDVGRQMESQYGVLGTSTREGSQLNAQLDRVVNRIVGAINDEPRDHDFRLRSAKILGGRSSKGDQVVNAFALPDGRIYVMLGLMRMIEDSPHSDDELAFVVGHEVTHVVEHHSAEQQKQAIGLGLGAILLGAVTRSQAIGTAAQYGAAARVSHFGRKDEYAADKGGVRAMTQAGYDPNAAVTMLGRLKAKGEGGNKTINGWFGSHPITENRVKRVQDMIADSRTGRDSRSRSSNDYER